MLLNNNLITWNYIVSKSQKKLGLTLAKGEPNTGGDIRFSPVYDAVSGAVLKQEVHFLYLTKTKDQCFQCRTTCKDGPHVNTLDREMTAPTGKSSELQIGLQTVERLTEVKSSSTTKRSFRTSVRFTDRLKQWFPTFIP